MANVRYVISHWLCTHLPSRVRWLSVPRKKFGVEWCIVSSDMYYSIYFDIRYLWPLLQLEHAGWKLVLGTGYHTNGAVKGVDSCKETFFHLLGFCLNITDYWFWRYKQR